MTVRTTLLTILIIILSQQLGKAQHTSALKGKVIDVVQKGYLLNGKIIRFAKVVVGS